ncbi:hypothetical protein AB0C18_38065 [Nonomuraea muscovyensis]
MTTREEAVAVINTERIARMSVQLGVQDLRRWSRRRRYLHLAWVAR